MRFFDWLRGETAQAPEPPGEERALQHLFETWQGLQPKERVENDFPSYVQAGYKGNSIVFSVIQTRMSLFSDVRFTWRDKTKFNTFGSADLDLLEHPWTNGSSRELLARMEQDVSLSGNAFIIRASDTELQRLRPDWVEIMSDSRKVTGYVYTPGGPGHDGGIFLLPEDIAHWSPIPDPSANFRGMSWLTPLINEITADSQMTQHKQKFFENAATPNLLVKIVDTLAPESRERLRAQLDTSYGGSRNAYRTMILENGADATVIGKDMQQISFEALQAAGENRIATAGRVPGIIAGFKEGLQAATYSNYAQAMRAFLDMWCYPQWGSVCTGLQKLVTPPNSGAELWYETSQTQALRQNEKDKADIELIKAQTVVEYLRAGYDPAAILAYVDTYEGLTTMPHTGDVYFPGNPNQGAPVVEAAPDGTTAPASSNPPAIAKPKPPALAAGNGKVN